MQSLFDKTTHDHRRQAAPLADRMRPQRLDEFVGQETLLGEGKPLRVLIERDQVPSLILWGPPGCGKTTLAKVMAGMTHSTFVELSAVMAGVAEIRRVVKEAQERLDNKGGKTILFIDEIHRFNKGQQDSLLPYVERGVVTLIGATTENPSFEVNAALLSRCRVFVLEKINQTAMQKILRAALQDNDRGLGKKKIQVEDDVLQVLATIADGDARHALNALELAVGSAPEQEGEQRVTVVGVRTALQRSHLLYDRAGEEHYNIISALHKSMRGSDPNASLYWLGRMLEAGEDPLYVARRLVRFASEDIGVADPQALVQTVAAFQAAHFLGMPECNVNLAQAVVYLAQAPKSNALYTAYQSVRHDIQHEPNEPVPLHLRNAPTGLMKGLGYGEGYIYPPNASGEIQQTYLPQSLQTRVYWKDRPEEC